jgi:hypothetical protein
VDARLETSALGGSKIGVPYAGKICRRAENKNGRHARACRPKFVCEVVTPANRDHAYLEGLDVRGLQALGTLGDFEFNRLAIIQRLVAISHDCGEVDENVLSTLALDESKALAGIEPLHCSLFFTHCIYSFLLTALRSYFEPGRVGTELLNKLSGASTPNPSKEFRAAFGRKKSRKCDLATLYDSKGDTRATNANTA